MNDDPNLSERMMARRRFVKLAAGAVLGAGLSSALAACGDSATASKAGATSATTASATTASAATASATSAATSSSASQTSPAAVETMPGMPGMPMPTSPATGAVALSTTVNAISNNVGFTGTLTIPPLIVPQMQNGTKVFNLTLQPGSSQFVAGTTTPTFGINGNYLGPTVRVSQGDKVLMNVTNHLGESLTLHWHGLHVPAAMDGGPHQVIENNAIWSPQFAVQQPAATLWYHPHMMGATQRQVTRGLAGMLIIDDSNLVQANLPHTYGVDDLPLILQDLPNGGGGGRGGGGGGGVTLVNGNIAPNMTTAQGRLRLRLLNASAQRFYNIGFTNNQTFYQIASDGGLLPAPVSMTRLQLAPAERVEIIVDLNASQPTVLQTFGGNGGGGGRGGGGNNGATGTLLTINRTGTTGNLASLPTQLASIERLQATQVSQTRDMVLGGGGRNLTINNQSMTSMADMMNLDSAVKVKLGATEVWNVINRSGDTHAFHVHDIQFQILDRNGATPGANEAGLKDTVMVNPRETVRIIMRFTDFADPNTPYMFHCHVLNHEDNGMMGQFLVLAA